MPVRSWLLCDTASQTHLDSLALGPTELGLPGCTVRKRTLRGGLTDGVELVELYNGAVMAAVLPTRGMGLWRVRQQPTAESIAKPVKDGGVALGWQSPVPGPVHPKHVPLFAPNGLGWLGGFDELLVRCGLESNGPPVWDDAQRLRHPLHGAIANQPAQRVELQADTDAGELRLVGQVDESRLFHNKLRLTATYRMRPGALRIDLLDEVENLSALPGELQLLYHINFGSPLVETSAQVAAPVAELVPATKRAAEGVSHWNTYEPPQVNFAEQVYLLKLAADAQGATEALLHNARAQQGVSVHCNVKQLPCFTIWKSSQMPQDGYVTGLEPGTNYPNPRAHEKSQGRVATLAAGEKRSFAIGLEIHPSEAAVRAAQQRVEKLQASVTPKIHAEPQPGWTAT